MADVTSPSPSASGILSPPLASTILSPTAANDSNHDSPRSSMDTSSQLEQELAQVRQEKDVLSNQYRNLLGKLTAMRQSLGEKLREDAEELDRRETTIHALNTDKEGLQQTMNTLQAELVNVNQESANLQQQLQQLRSQSDSSSSDVLSLTREMRELRGEMERLRLEREEWETEAGRERERREGMEEEARQLERRERDGRREWERGRDEMMSEKERARNLQEVLGEFQAAKDSELHQATSELETQLRIAATSLSEFKLRAANAESSLAELANDASRSARLDKEITEKNQIIGKLRHDAVVNNEHLTEALRRLRKNSSDNNVDRRLVTNILLSFLTTSRADSKRFEMLSLLSTILAWDDTEREKAGLQRIGASAGSSSAKSPVEKKKGGRGQERSAEEEAAMNESFSNLFVEFLLKEASQGQSARPAMASPSESNPNLSQNPFPPLRSPPGSVSYSPPTTNSTNTPITRPRRLSSSSNVSGLGLPAVQRKGSYNLHQAMQGEKGG